MSNYAAPGAKVGIQAGTVVISGGVSVAADGIQVGDVSDDDDTDDE